LIAVVGALCVVAATWGSGAAAFADAPPASAETGGSVVVAQGADWSVTRLPGGYQVQKSLTDPLPVRDDAPTLWADHDPLGIATVSQDGLTLTVSTTDAAVETTTSVLQGWSSEGDPAAPPADDPTAAAPTAPAPAGAVLAEDPASAGPYGVERDDYDFGDTAEPIAGSDGKTGEMRAALYMPHGAPGERPVVVFLHGRHSACSDSNGFWPCPEGQEAIPSYLGYDAPAEALASEGYAVLSISADAIGVYDNALPDGGAYARGQLVLDHLALLQKADDGDAVGLNPSLAGRLDLQHVGLMGHSRGGDGVVRAALLNAELPHPFGIDAVMPLAPTDFNRTTLPDVPMAVVLPYCDGDLKDLQGQHYFDDSRTAYDDDVLRSSVLVMGANHNYFNTVWTPGEYPYQTSDDWPLPDDPTCGASAPTRLSSDAQNAIGTSYIAGFFRLTMGGEDQFMPMFDGSGARPASAADADVRTSASLPASDRLDIDTFADPDAPVQVSGAGSAETCASAVGAPSPAALPLCDRSLTWDQLPDFGPMWHAPYVPATPAMHFSYTAPPAVDDPAGELAVPMPGGPADVSGMQSLSLRATPDGTMTAGTDLDLTLVDGSGATASVSASAYGTALSMLPGTDRYLPKILLQQIRIPVSAFSGVDLTDVTAVRLTAPRADGGVLLSDLAFLGESSVGHPSISTRPFVSIPDVTVGEGDGAGSVSVPVVLSRAADVPATVWFSEEGGSPEVQKVTVPAGQRCVAVALPLDGDGVDSGVGLASYSVNVSNTQDGSTIGRAFAKLRVGEDDSPASVSYGVQGDACAEALAGPGTLTVSPASAKPGDIVTVSGSGFRADETVSLSLHSDPVALGAALSSSEGSVSFSTVVPDAPTGDHQLVAVGTGSGQTDSAPYTITADADNGGGTNGDGTKPAVLAATGSDPSMPALVASVLLAAGATTLLICRRTRRVRRA
jgi:hypothetical protein